MMLKVLSKKLIYMIVSLSLAITIPIASIISTPEQAEAVQEGPNYWTEYPGEIYVHINRAWLDRMWNGTSVLHSTFGFSIDGVNWEWLGSEIYVYGQCINPSRIAYGGTAYTDLWVRAWWTGWGYDFIFEDWMWGPVSYGAAAQCSKTYWSRLEHTWQNVQLTAYGNIVPVVKETRRYYRHHLTYAEQSNPSQVLAPYQPLYNGWASWDVAGPQRQVTYYGKTNPDQYSHTQTLIAQWQDMYVDRTRYVVDGWCVTREWGDPVVYNTRNTTNIIQYKADSPIVTQEYYTPYNLNYNSISRQTDTVGKLSGSSIQFYDKNPLELSINSGVSDGEPINALDTYTGKPFEVNFLNNQLGMPSIYNFNETPEEFSEGTYANVDQSLPYANGIAPSNSDGCYRWDVKLHAAMSNNVEKAASLSYGDEEYTFEEPMEKGTTETSSFYGGEFLARFVFPGIFSTANGIDDSEDPLYWVNTYKQGKLFEYGTEYRGIINSWGIYAPTLLNGCQASTNPGFGNAMSFNSTFSWKTNGISNRGLYVGISQTEFEQPVLFGYWKAKTVAGDLN